MKGGGGDTKKSLPAKEEEEGIPTSSTSLSLSSAFPLLLLFLVDREREIKCVVPGKERERVGAFYINGPIQCVHWPCNLEKKCVFVLRISILGLSCEQVIRRELVDQVSRAQARLTVTAPAYLNSSLERAIDCRAISGEDQMELNQSAPAFVEEKILLS